MTNKNEKSGRAVIINKKGGADKEERDEINQCVRVWKGCGGGKEMMD